MSFKFLAFSPRIIFLVVALLAVVIVIRLMINSKFEVRGIQSEILVQGLLYGPGGITYYDPLTGRIYPEIVDPSQFNESKYDMGFHFSPNSLITARILLVKEKETLKKLHFGKSKNMISNVDPSDVVGVTYFNKEWWDNWKPLAESKIRGLGRVDIDNTELPILYRDADGGLHSGWLYITVLQPG